jgi:hypothetical protein
MSEDGAGTHRQGGQQERFGAVRDAAGRHEEQLVTVRLLRLPVPLQTRAQEHADELIRELTLIGEQMRQRGDHAGLPARLVTLVDELTGKYSMFTSAQEQELAEAAATGVTEIDLTYAVPASVADAALALRDILDEADDYCRAGQHLLTLPTPADLVRYRRWFLDQFVGQTHGVEPVPFPAYVDRPPRDLPARRR